MGEVNFHSQPNVVTNYHHKQSHESEVHLLYPLSWKVECHPLAKIVERKVLAWLREIGVVQNAENEKRFEKLTVWAYVGWPFPKCSAEHLEVLMKFLALWIFYDDIIEEEDDGVQNLVQQAVAGALDEFPGGSPHFRGWWELGRACAQTMSATWLRRHGERFAQWIRSVREECAAANQFRKSGIFPPAAKHLERRALNIGMVPNIDFLEYQMGWELPESLLQDSDMKLLEILSAEVVAIINDLYGFGKDNALRWCNMIPCLSQEFHVPSEESFRWTVAMHNNRVRRIQETESRLLQHGADRKPLAQWLDGLHHIMYGFARWHEIAARYSNFHLLEDGGKIRVAVQEIPEFIHS